VDSSGSDVLTVINPANEEAIATVPRGSAEDVDRAAQAAAAAFESWSQWPVNERAEIIAKLARLIEARSDEVTRMIVSEVGQPMRFAVKDVSCPERLPGSTDKPAIVTPPD
jgi:aldehyde dehydrogenase (NAD+)